MLLFVLLCTGSDLQAEVENLSLRIFYMMNAKDDVRADIAVMKRAAEKAESEVVPDVVELGRLRVAVLCHLGNVIVQTLQQHLVASQLLLHAVQVNADRLALVLLRSHSFRL